MAQVFSETGIALGAALFAATTWATWLGMVLLVDAADARRVDDYGDLALVVFGARAKILMDFLIFAGGTARSSTTT